MVDNRGSLTHYVIIVAPHTSNLDFFIGLATAFVLRLKFRWLGKHTIFIGPIGVLLKSLGGVPIDRRSSQNTVEQVISRFDDKKAFVFALAPEGTRSKKDRWKSGFYHIAVQAKVPLVLGFIDFAKKETGLGATLNLTGSPKEDMDKIRAFYQTKQGKFPHEASPIQIEEENSTRIP